MYSPKFATKSDADSFIPRFSNVLSIFCTIVAMFSLFFSKSFISPTSKPLIMANGNIIIIKDNIITSIAATLRFKFLFLTNQFCNGWKRINKINAPKIPLMNGYNPQARIAKRAIIIAPAIIL